LITDAAGIILAVFMEHPIATLWVIIALEVPRYSFAIFALAVVRLQKKSPQITTRQTISAIVPVFNGALETALTIESLLNQTCPIDEIIIVDDGSTLAQHDRLVEIAKQSEKIRLIRHSKRAGKSAAINHAAYLATGDLLLVIDHDTWLHTKACERLANNFMNPRVAIASGNLIVNNRQKNPLTSMQSLEYLLSVTIGRGFLNYLGAISCCSGAFSMFRANVFRAIGGMNVGPGEDLEITLRIRKAGYLVRFAENALAETTVPQSVAALIRQRIRWDGDAVAIRLLMYDETSFFDRRESSSDVFQRLDYIFLELVPALVFPFYLMTLWLDYGYNMIDVLIAIYVVLFWLYFFNLILAIIMTRRRLSVLDLLVLVLMPIYLGLLMRLIRLVAISYEILGARSQRSPFVPSRIREALYGRLK